MKVLVAEDDPLTAEALQACLEPEGFVALLAADGAQALELWKRERPDLLCIDVMIPGIDGYELCRRIRAENQDVPILFLSAKSEEIDVVVGLELGADDFIRKPFGKHELIARIRAALRRTQSRRPQAQRRSFSMHGLVVYPNELRAERDGLEIALTPRETAILQLLHERRGEAVSRDVLLDRCWGVNYFPESRTLDQHIAKLRKRIERDPSNPEIIETVRGLGYRYREDGAIERRSPVTHPG